MTKQLNDLSAGWNCAIHGSDKATAVFVVDRTENLRIEVSGLDPNTRNPREVSQITVTFGNKTWTGTIQDFFAIQAITENSLKEFYLSVCSDVHENLGEIITELESLLSHFK